MLKTIDLDILNVRTWVCFNSDVIFCFVLPDLNAQWLWLIWFSFFIRFTCKGLLLVELLIWHGLNVMRTCWWSWRICLTLKVSSVDQQRNGKLSTRMMKMTWWWLGMTHGSKLTWRASSLFLLYMFLLVLDFYVDDFFWWQWVLQHGEEDFHIYIWGSEEVITQD